MAEVFLDDDRWNALAEALAALEPCPVTGRITPDVVKLALAERDILPASIRSGLIRCAVEDRMALH